MFAYNSEDLLHLHHSICIEIFSFFLYGTEISPSHLRRLQQHAFQYFWFFWWHSSSPSKCTSDSFTYKLWILPQMSRPLFSTGLWYRISTVFIYIYVSFQDVICRQNQTSCSLILHFNNTFYNHITSQKHVLLLSIKLFMYLSLTIPFRLELLDNTAKWVYTVLTH